MTLFTKSVTAMFLLVGSVMANAAVVRIDASAFKSQAGLITFSEKPLGTNNPVYTPGDYGGTSGAPNVRFAGYFSGQSIGTPSTCPAGAAVTGCVVGMPSGPLNLDARSQAVIVSDSSNPTSPVLSGAPTFNGPISILFDVDLAGVGLDGGFFDASNGTAITAFARNGSVLGSVTNKGRGIEFLGLVTDDGSAQIAGLQFSLVGNEPAGFAIDNVRFGIAGQVSVPGGDVPEPGSLALLTVALAGMSAARRKRKL